MRQISDIVAEEKTYAGGLGMLQDVIIGVVLVYVVVGLFQSVIIAMGLPVAANTAVNSFFTSFWSMTGLFIVVILVTIVSFIRTGR